MAIKILITGGTIDSEYNQLNGKLFFTKSHLSEILHQAKCKINIKLETVMLKDSNDMLDSDRKEILQNCKNCKEDKIIITHGTDTMPETAKVLGENIKDKTIVLFGAMIPYAFGRSDALFNFGCAVSAVQILPKGVYITMNGKIFPYNNVRKNKEIGEFENLV